MGYAPHCPVQWAVKSRNRVFIRWLILDRRWPDFWVIRDAGTELEAGRWRRRIEKP